MESLIITQPKRVNQWMNNYISPGPVAPLGDVLVNVKLKKSCPELLPRYQFTDAELARRGVGVQDGQWYNVHNDSLGPIVYRQSHYDKSYDRRQIGISMQDIRLGDLKADVRMLGAPQFGWKSKQANVLNARVTGEQFLPAPQGYQPEGLSRGNQPRINMLVDNTSPIAPLEPLKPLPKLVTNAPELETNINNIGIENIQQTRVPDRNIRTGFLSGRY